MPRKERSSSSRWHAASHRASAGSWPTPQPNSASSCAREYRSPLREAPLGALSLLLLIVLCSVVGFSSSQLLQKAVLRPYQIARGSGYFGLLSSGFVHADITHLVFNLITFYSFGFPLERVIGTMRFLLLYFAGLLISGLGTT